MTDVQTFRAQSMKEALRIVKANMGPDAVILHTRQIPGKRLLPWQSVPDEVEITAGVGLNIPSQASVPRPTPAPKPVPTVPHPIEKAYPAQAALKDNQGVTVEISQRTSPNKPHFSPSVPQNERPISQMPASPQQASDEPTVAELARQIESIQNMLQALGLQSQMAPNKNQPSPSEEADELTPTLEALHQRLEDIEVPGTMARELVTQLKTDCTPAQLEDPVATNAMLASLIEQQLNVGGPIRLEPGQQKVVALVGATGVGKTTTIAKLAANFRLRNHVKMGLVTVDTYRIAAVEQLRTYAEIIDLPMKVVTNPLEMRRALDELAGLDLVLIDTAGRSPRDELQIQELKRLLLEARVDEVHLVLSLTSSLGSLLSSAEKFALANATSLILTKLDEAATMGNLLSLSRKVNLPISYLTTGQDVPNDIEPASADRLARLIIGRDQILN